MTRRQLISGVDDGSRPSERVFGSPAFSPSGSIFVVQDDNQTDPVTDIWRPAGGREPVLPISPGAASSVVPGPQNLIAKISVRGQIDLVNATNGDPEGKISIPAHDGYITDALSSPDGRIIAASNGKGEIYLWNLASKRKIAKLTFEKLFNDTSPGNPGSVPDITAISFSPDSRMIAAASSTGIVRVWDLATRQSISTFNINGDDRTGAAARPVETLIFSPDGTHLVTNDGDSLLALWDVASGRQIAAVAIRGGRLASAAITKAGALVIATKAENASSSQIGIWTTGTSRLTAILSSGGNLSAGSPRIPATARHAARTPASQRTHPAQPRPGGTAYVLLTPLTGLIQPINLLTNTPGRPFKTTGWNGSPPITPDGKTVYVPGARSGTIVPVDLASRQAGAAITVGSEVGTIAVSPSGGTAYVGYGETITPINLASRSPGTPIEVPFGVTTIAITPDGRTAYAIGHNIVTPVNLITGTARAPIPVTGGPVSIAFTPDSKMAYILGSVLRKFVNFATITPIRIANSTAEAPIHLGKSVPFPAIAITPDGKTAYVAGIGYTGNLVIPINLAANTASTPIHAGKDGQAIAITPDGTTAYIVDNHGLAEPSEVIPLNLATGRPESPIKLASEAAISIVIVP